MNDLISQQKVISLPVKPKEDRYFKTKSLDDAYEYGWRDLQRCIEKLSPTQLELYGDVVSRNAIVQKLNKMDRYVSTELRLCDTDKKFPKNEVFIVDDVYEEIVEQLPPAQPEQQWILCSEGLPKSMDFVLLTVRRMDKSYNQRPFISVGYIDMNQISWWCVHDGNCKSANVEVIAWMSLPKPYEGR